MVVVIALVDLRLCPSRAWQARPVVPRHVAPGQRVIGLRQIDGMPRVLACKISQQHGVMIVGLEDGHQPHSGQPNPGTCPRLLHIRDAAEQQRKEMISGRGASFGFAPSRRLPDSDGTPGMLSGRYHTVSPCARRSAKREFCQF